MDLLRGSPRPRRRRGRRVVCVEIEAVYAAFRIAVVAWRRDARRVSPLDASLRTTRFSARRAPPHDAPRHTAPATFSTLPAFSPRARRPPWHGQSLSWRCTTMCVAPCHVACTALAVHLLTSVAPFSLSLSLPPPPPPHTHTRNGPRGSGSARCPTLAPPRRTTRYTAPLALPPTGWHQSLLRGSCRRGRLTPPPPRSRAATRASPPPSPAQLCVAWRPPPRRPSGVFRGSSMR